MAKITQVTIMNSSTIRLDVDARCGDEIDLLEISKIDNALIQMKIEEAKNKEIKERVDEVRKSFEEEKKKDIASMVTRCEASFQKEISDLKQQILSLQNKNENFENAKALEIKALKVELELKNKENENTLKEKITSLENQIKLERLEIENSYKEKLREQTEVYNASLQEKQKTINDLTLAKSNLNVKKLGEQLESWCNTEYENYAQCGFDNCSWEKDNTAIKDEGDAKGTKADYIFKVYASSKLQQNELLTSVACEMKNESPTSTNKKKNADHYAKLDKDRNKKNCEYALLISELEWDQVNDIPIKKVKEYDKMYVVRPQYFINFLSIINSLSLKYKELLLEEIKEEEMFKDVSEIKEEFEKFKKDLFEKPLQKLETKLLDIIKNAEQIQKCSDNIISSATDLISKTLEGMKNKIENYKIEKITKKIDKLN